MQKLSSKLIDAPWSPACQGPSDSDYESSSKTELRDVIAENELMLRKPEIQGTYFFKIELFDGYEYTRPTFRLI